MIKKKKILLFVCLVMSILSVSKVYADSDGEVIIEIFSNTSDSNSGSNNGGTTGEKKYSNWIYYKDDGKRIKYRYSFQTWTNSSYSIKYYNPTDGAIKSGTWMGIHINEIQSASWNVLDIEYKEVKKVYTCTVTKPICDCYYGTAYTIVGQEIVSVKKRICQGDPNYRPSIGCKKSSSTSTTYKKDYYDDSPCSADSTETFTENDEDINESETTSKKKEVYTLAHNSAAGSIGAPFSKLQIITDELDEKNNHKTETILGSLVSTSDSGVEKSGTISKTYSYKPSSICINLKTGKVRYNKECKQDEEVKINPYIDREIEYWQYFSPLDTKSGTSFSLAIKKNDARVLSNTECHNTMNKYKNQYQNYIVSINNKALNGDYCKNGNCNNLNTGSGSDWQEVSKGCYFSTVLNFDVVQKYYFEEMKNNELKFNGYNLYYRPININNPFPTSPTENSIWYEWYNSINKTPNLKDSFNEVTYSVDVSNKLADTIRAYNTNNPYPSFDKLSLNGTSSFLQSIGVVSLTGDKVNKLGEGTKTCIKNGTVSIGSDCS